MDTTNIAESGTSYDIMAKIGDTLIKKIDLLLNLNDVNTLSKDIYNDIITPSMKNLTSIIYVPVTLPSIILQVIKTEFPED